MEYEIKKFDPCKSAIEFRKEFKSFEEAWDACPRGDWMLWLASKLKVDKRLLTLTKGYCAKTVEHLMKDERSKKAVQAAIDYGNNLIDEEELRGAAATAYAATATAAAAAAAAAADDAAAAAYAAYAAYAAAAAYAAYAAAAADAAADAAAYAAYAAADAAADAAAYAAKKENQKLTADICRKYLSKIVFKLIYEF
jgi:hypothetical protein